MSYKSFQTRKTAIIVSTYKENRRKISILIVLVEVLKPWAGQVEAKYANQFSNVRQGKNPFAFH